MSVAPPISHTGADVAQGDLVRHLVEEHGLSESFIEEKRRIGGDDKLARDHTEMHAGKSMIG